MKCCRASRGHSNRSCFNKRTGLVAPETEAPEAPSEETAGPVTESNRGISALIVNSPHRHGRIEVLTLGLI
jgi:hypothetical protein